MKGKVSAGILGIASIMGGVDASTLNEQPIEVVETVAGYEVKAEQVGDVIEATLPWKDQPGLTVAYDMGEPSLAERFTDKRTEQVVMEKVDFGDGGFKIDVLLSEKPSTNKFCYQIEGAENYDFFYQPPLTKEEIAEGAYRPPEIEGSYAVYHKTLKNHVIGQENYATGKVMHIPRPQVWEVGKEDQKVWADLSYDAGQLCVTAPQGFLDSATYPVRIDPTFGYTTVGASVAQIAGDSGTDTATRQGSGFDLTEDYSVVTNIIANLSSVSTGETVDITAFINLKNSVAFNSHGLLTSVERTDVPITTSKIWYDFSLPETSIAVDEYILNIVGDPADLGGSGTVNISYDSTAGAYRLTENFTSTPYASAQEDPWTDDNSGSLTFSIYATYTTIPQTTLRLNNGTILINNGTLDI